MVRREAIDIVPMKWERNRKAPSAKNKLGRQKWGAGRMMEEIFGG